MATGTDTVDAPQSSTLPPGYTITEGSPIAAPSSPAPPSGATPSVGGLPPGYTIQGGEGDEDISAAAPPPPDKFQQGEDFKTKAWQDVGHKLWNNDYLGAIHSFASLFSSQNPAAKESYRQLQKGGIGAAKAAGQGAATIGDLATLGLTHLLPDEWRPPGTGLGYLNAAPQQTLTSVITGKPPVSPLQPVGEEEKAGFIGGQLGMFAVGEGLFNALADLPMVERITQAGKLLDIVKAHPELAASVGRIVKGAGGAAAGGLVATGSPQQAVTAGTVGAAAGAVGEVAGPVIQALRRPVAKGLQTASEAVDPDIMGMVSPRVASAQRYAGKVGRALAPEEEAAAEAPTALGPEESPLIHQPYIQDGIRDRLNALADTTAQRAEQAEQQLLGKTRTTPMALRPAATTDVRDMAEELSDNIETTAQQNFFKPIDDATDVGEGGQFTKLDKALKKNASDLKQATDPDVQARLEEQRSGLHSQMDDVIDMAKKAGVNPKVADFANELWKQKSALDELDAQIKAAMPHHLQIDGPQIDTKSFVNRVGKLREAGRSKVTGPGRLADAFGGDQAAADDFKAHADESYRRSTAPIFPPAVTPSTAPAATRAARPSVAAPAGAAATTGRQTAAPAAAVAPAAAPAAATAPTKSAPSDTTNVWQAFPNPNELANLLTDMEGGMSNPTIVRNNNPGNLKVPGKSNVFQKFPTMEEGRAAQLRQIAKWKRDHPDWSIAQFNRNHAPDKSHGGDNPDGTEAGRNRRMLAELGSAGGGR